MTLVRGRGRPRQEHPSVASSIALFDSSPPPKLGDKLSKQPARPLGIKHLVVIALVAAANIPKHFKNDLQKIFKTVQEDRAPAPAPALAPTPTPTSAFAPAPVSALAVSKMSRNKLKARSPDVYNRKSHIDCLNFCQ